MSQHDFDVANQSGAAFRADLNLAFQALASSNSGPLEPPVKFANQFWGDTTANLLRIRNASNTGWIALGDISLPNLGLIQPGAILYLAHLNALNGYLKCNGAAVSRTTFAGLFNNIGTTYGLGDGSSTFNLPELRGEFIRVIDDGRGVDVGRGLNAPQASQNLQHTHAAPAASSGFWVDQPGLGIVNIGGSNLNINRFPTTDASVSGGGTEARPRNVAMYAVIKY